MTGQRRPEDIRGIIGHIAGQSLPYHSMFISCRIAFCEVVNPFRSMNAFHSIDSHRIDRVLSSKRSSIAPGKTFLQPEGDFSLENLCFRVGKVPGGKAVSTAAACFRDCGHEYCSLLHLHRVAVKINDHIAADDGNRFGHNRDIFKYHRCDLAVTCIKGSVINAFQHRPHRL